MLKIYVVRHGETYFNTVEIVQGHNDSPLTKFGQDQARYVGYGLRNVPFVSSYSGDTTRQVETAKLILSFNFTASNQVVLQNPNFREMNYGNFQGGSYRDMLTPIYHSLGLEYNGYEALNEYMSCNEIADYLASHDKSGEIESVQTTGKRMVKGIKQIIHDNQAGDVLLATSSNAIGALVTQLFPDFEVKTLVSNCSVTIIRYENDTFYLDDYNQMKYYDEGKEALDK